MRALLLLALAARLSAQSLAIPEDKLPLMDKAVAKLAKALEAGKSAALPLPAAPAAWDAAGLEAALASKADFVLGSDAPQGKLARKGSVKLLLIENQSTVSPLSKKLGAWGLPFTVLDFGRLEKSPAASLDPQAWDLVVFSSPGWWENFSDPPSGPSRMGDGVAEALRAYVGKGGTAVFIDLAQWDLEKCWPKTLRLASLGPWQLDRFKVKGAAKEGKLSLAPEGVAAEKISAPGKALLVEQPAFRYPDGNIAPAYAAYALPDPGGGSGIVAGFGLHVFEQDEALAGRLRRIFLNLLFISGVTRPERGEAPPAATATPRPSFTPTPSFSAVPTPVPPKPTAAPTAVPTAAPSPVPTARPTLAPTKLPTLPPTEIPTLRPSPRPSPVPTPLPTLAPTTLPTRAPTLAPSLAPTAIPTFAPLPTPAPKPRLLRTLQPAPTFVPLRVKDAIGCVQSSPEPFSEGGVYVFYCLKHAGTVTLKVFSLKGKQLFASEPKFEVPGSHQIFFGGSDQKGRGLASGRYQYRLEAHYDEDSIEWRHGEFNLKRKKR
jgi:cell division septation protein DedD